MSLQPQCVRVHPHRRAFAQDRITVPSGSLRCSSSGRIRNGWSAGMAHAKHPLVAPHGAHAAADLVGERLKGEPMVGRGASARRWRRSGLGSLNTARNGRSLLRTGAAAGVHILGTESAIRRTLHAPGAAVRWKRWIAYRKKSARTR